MSDLVFTAPSAASRHTAPQGAVTRCVSFLLSHLSLSLSLSWRGWLAASSPRLGSEEPAGFPLGGKRSPWALAHGLGLICASLRALPCQRGGCPSGLEEGMCR
jgi:hypothetical protein